MALMVESISLTFCLWVVLGVLGTIIPGELMQIPYLLFAVGWILSIITFISGYKSGCVH